MNGERALVGEVLALQRRAINVEPSGQYEEIGVRSFGRGIFHKEPVSGATLGNKRVFRIEPGDLVLSNVFAWEGAVAVASAKDTGKIGSHRFMTYVPVADRIDTRWAAWFFVSEPGLELIRKASPGSAGRNKTLAIERFEAMEIPLPPRDEQIRTAARIDAVAMAVERIGALATKSTVRREAFIESLVHGLGLTDAKRRADGWRHVNLGHVLSLAIDSRDVLPENSYEMAGIYSFGRGLFARGRIEGTDTKYRALHRLRTGQLVMSRLKAWEGAIAVVPPELDGYYLSPEFPTFDLAPDLHPQYLDLLVRTRRFWEELASGSKGVGARRERVNAERLLRQHIDLPSAAAQRVIGRLSTSLREAEAALGSRTRMVQAMIPAHLNDAFAGLL